MYLHSYCLKTISRRWWLFVLSLDAYLGLFHSYLILYGPTWDGASQVSKHHLAKYWANLGHSVLYVESQFHLLSFITRAKEAFRLLTRFIFGPNKVCLLYTSPSPRDRG